MKAAWGVFCTFNGAAALLALRVYIHYRPSHENTRGSIPVDRNSRSRILKAVAAGGVLIRCEAKNTAALILGWNTEEKRDFTAAEAEAAATAAGATCIPGSPYLVRETVRYVHYACSTQRGCSEFTLNNRRSATSASASAAAAAAGAAACRSLPVVVVIAFASAIPPTKCLERHCT